MKHLLVAGALVLLTSLPSGARAGLWGTAGKVSRINSASASAHNGYRGKVTIGTNAYFWGQNTTSCGTVQPPADRSLLHLALIHQLTVTPVYVETKSASGYKYRCLVEFVVNKP